MGGIVHFGPSSSGLGGPGGAGIHGDRAWGGPGERSGSRLSRRRGWRDRRECRPVRGSLSGCAYRLDLTNGNTSLLASSIRGHTGCTWQAPESCPNAQKTASLQAEKSVACSDAVVMTLDNPRSEAL